MIEPIILIIQLLYADGSHSHEAIEINRGYLSLTYCLTYRDELREAHRDALHEDIRCVGF